MEYNPSSRPGVKFDMTTLRYAVEQSDLSYSTTSNTVEVDDTEIKTPNAND